MRQQQQQLFYQNTYAFNFKLLHYSGYWTPKSTIFSNILRQVININFILLFLSQIIAAYNVNMRESFSEGNPAITSATSIGFILGKFFFLQRSMKSLQCLQETLNTGISLIIPPTNVWPILNRGTKQARQLLTLVILFFASTLCVWSVVPLFESKWTLPLPIWLPFDIKRWPLYQIFYIHNVLMMLLSVLWFVAFDMMFCMFLIQISVQYDLLIWKVTNLLKRPPRRSVLRLVPIIQHHQHIIKIVDELRRIYRLPILLHFAGGSILICLCLFEISLLRPISDPFQYGFKVMYLLCSVGDLFMYSWCGQLIINKSNRLLKAIYSLPWYHMDKTSVIIVKMMMIRSQNAPHLVIAGLTPLHLPAYLAMLTVVYNVFSVLRQISYSLLVKRKNN